MRGTMQDWPLLCPKILDHAARLHPHRTILSRSVEGPLHTTTWAEVHSRARRVAKRLARDRIGFGDRVATLAWNTWRHLEVWYGLLGLGAIYHTVNPRLFHEQIAWIINDAEDRLLFVDLTFLPIVEILADKLPTIERIVVLTDGAHLPETRLTNVVAYEDWLAEADDDFAWATFDETTAAGLCYTSGTTGHPKGVLYSHRSNVLHAWQAATVDMFGCSSRDVVMPVVPMFHANCWSLAFTAPLVGAALVMPGAKLDGASIHEMLEVGRVTLTAAVPTVWLMLLRHMEAKGLGLSHLKRVVIGGAACPRAITEAFETTYDVRVAHAWGMTETSPLGTVCGPKPETADLDLAGRLDLQIKQGVPPFGVEMKITDDEGRERPRDGRAFGRLKVRGPAVTGAYFKGAGAECFDADGFFDTGDVATIDANGYMQITDRAKDVVKSGGEWISTIDLENLAIAHPDVQEAAVIGVPHPKWDERPLLIVVVKDGRSPTKDDILGFFEGKIAKWWMPDDVVFVDEIPHTATGKIQKTVLRERYAK
ncbi:long-chain-fatty-acid--CoA ligase [Siculibacillus lacustris]|uniref:3-methylmercaptopropionyl-CoA ligase n=1 Tax=Siculibacillus lacustris TaxID=1549641 RepID=A0A4V2KSW4_9HYPH|nr:long-chain-fatty-acid--CoA ligase [Siculibacillus lacustris]TBW34516.1 long-chain-fatty-acid--CoA ligase [Siculibacillus lacustris]